MKRQKSVRTILLSIFCTLLVVTVLCFAVCGGYSLYTSEQELLRHNQASLDVYLKDLSYTMQELEKFNQDITANNLDFVTLSLDYPELVGAHQIESRMNVQRLIRNRVGENTGILLFSDKDEDVFFANGTHFMDEFFPSGAVSPEGIEEMQRIRSLWLSETPPPTQCWVSYVTDDTTLLMNAYAYQGVYLCALVDVDAFSRFYTENNELTAIEYAFLTQERVLTNTDFTESRGITVEEMLRAVETPVWHSATCLLQTAVNDTHGVGICGIISLGGIWNHLRVYVILLGGTFLIICLLFVSIYHLLNQLLLFPLDQITDATRQINEGATAIHSQPESIQEFQQIQDALEQLVQQKVSLAKDNMHQTYQKEHALLQYYQLQTRSHFVLNCMKTIYSLTVKGDQEKTMKIIGLFSNHLRYIYHDSLSLVPLRSEMVEVQDYFSIIELERSDHILLNQNVDPSLWDFQVPPLIIQTFVENFNKYNAQSDHILRFSIRVDKVHLDGRDYVRIRLTDNGVGYSEEALKSLQEMQQADGMFERNHVGVQNLCRRMDILYQKQYKRAFLNSPGGGALTVFCLPMELDEESPQTNRGEEL